MDNSVWGPMGVHTFRIKGNLYHRIGSLLPAEGEQPKFAQIYVMDSDPNQQIKQRLEHGHGCIRENILRDLQQMMYKKNPYYKIYSSAQKYPHPPYYVICAMTMPEIFQKERVTQYVIKHAFIGL
jgi:hypothetical protein